MDEHAHNRRVEEALPRFSLSRRIGVMVLLASILVVGVIATIGIPLELIPSGFTAPFLGVRVPWPDAPAQEVLDKIILPLEEELSTVSGIERLSSFAVTGIGGCFMSFKSGTEMDVAYREVRDRIERTRARLPEDVERILIRKEDDTSIPVFVLGLAVNPEIADPYSLIQNEVILHLQRIDGVASVDVQGLLEREIFIELDRERTEASGLNIYQLAMELGNDNFTMASGDVRHGDRKLLLRSVARYQDVEELRNRIVANNIRLRDIATISYKEPERRFRVRANSRPAVALVVLKEGQANTMEVAGRLRDEVERLQASPHLQEILMVPLFDQGAAILESLDTLLDSGRIGAIFAFVVLYFFLRRLRVTMIITLAIPLSILIALTVMFFAGESLNILSLLGLMISVGLLVDNSVVVAENIHRLHQRGMSRRDAVIRGVGEISLAIIMATLTTVIAFLPASLVEGQAQFFLLRMAIPISVALLASLFVATVFVPLMVYVTLRNGNQRKRLPRRLYNRFIGLSGALYEATLGRLNRGYTRLLGFSLQHRFGLVLTLVAVLVVTGMAAKSNEVKFVDMQEEERNGFEIDVSLPQSTTLEEAEALFLEYERIVESMADELGLSGWFLVHRATRGEVQGFFNNPRTTDLSPREVTERVLERLPEKPGVEYYTGKESDIDEESGEQVFVVSLVGENADQLEETAKGLEQTLIRVDGVLGIKKAGDQESASELALVIDRSQAQQQGINPQVVAGVVGYALRGQALGHYRSGGKDIPVRVRYQEQDRETLSQLKGFYVPVGEQGVVPLSSVTDVEFMPTQRRIFRRDKRVTRTITLELEEGEEDEARKRLRTLQSQIDLPEGVRFGEGSRRNQADEDLVALQFAAIISIVFIYLLMGFLFESFVLPLSIIFTIPLAVIGVIWSHIVAGYNIDFLGCVGIVLLIGVVVNNGIVLIDYVIRLRAEGRQRFEAMLLAAERRFRPIMMTALTTVCGMIPVALSGSTSLGISYSSFGLTLIGGLTTATLLTLLVVPIFYTLFDDARTSVVGAVRWGVSRGRREKPSITGAAPAGMPEA
jgi:HAE1 family hydrophobic/amphiphilic exporter-1